RRRPVTKRDDMLDPVALAARLGTGRRLGHRLEYHPVIDSTNDRARALAADGEPEGSIVLAGEQTRGRGRSDRSWHSAGGRGLYLAVILRPEAPAAGAPLLGLMAAVAVAEALDRFGPGRVRIQWPNDLVASRGEVGGVGPAWLKLAGILSESRAAQSR